MKNQRKRIGTPRIRSDGHAKDIVYSLEIDQIRANSAQPRRDFDIESIIKLADSIRRYGILQPLSVRRIPSENNKIEPQRGKKINLVADVLSASMEQSAGEPIYALQSKSLVPRETDNSSTHTAEQKTVLLNNFSAENTSPPPSASAEEKIAKESTPQKPPSPLLPKDTGLYELIAGERRLRAAKMLGLHSVPCIIVDVNDAISAELALVENMLRENLNMFEQASAFANLASKYSLTQEEIAARMSLSQSAVANKIRLLKLSESEQQLIMDANLTERHARAVLRISDPLLREEAITHIIDSKYNVSETDKYISFLLSAESQKVPKPAQTPAPTPERLCSNIYKFINRMQSISGNHLTVNRKSDGKNVIITLTVHKSS